MVRKEKEDEKEEEEKKVRTGMFFSTILSSKFDS